jgi:nicotinamidase-related amidase
MTPLSERPNSALLVIDFQNGVVASAWRRDEVLASIKEAVAAARVAGVPVVWVQDLGDDRTPGSDPWQIVPELDPREDEPRVQKRYGDSFEDTDLTDILSAADVGRLYVAGAQTDACIRSTLHGAFVRGYDTILVSDAHTTEDLTEWGAPSPEAVVAHTNLYWQVQDAPGRTAGVVKVADLDFAEA